MANYNRLLSMLGAVATHDDVVAVFGAAGTPTPVAGVSLANDFTARLIQQGNQKKSKPLFQLLFRTMQTDAFVQYESSVLLRHLCELNRWVAATNQVVAMYVLRTVNSFNDSRLSGNYDLVCTILRASMRARTSGKVFRLMAKMRCSFNVIEFEALCYASPTIVTEYLNGVNRETLAKGMGDLVVAVVSCFLFSVELWWYLPWVSFILKGVLFCCFPMVDLIHFMFVFLFCLQIHFDTGWIDDVPPTVGHPSTMCGWSFTDHRRHAVDARVLSHRHVRYACSCKLHVG